MANRTVPAEALKEGSVILIKGKLAFSRLAQRIDGQALADSVARQRAQNVLYPTIVPYTTVTLTDVEVLFADPSAPTPEETFVLESTYLSKSGDNAGKTCYSIDNTGNSLPPVLELTGENNSYTQVILDKDLATGLDVKLVLNVFKPREHIKRGIGIAQVLVDEAIKYYASGVDINALAARGIIVTGGIQAVPDAPAAAPAASAPNNTVIHDGLPMPGPAPVAQPVTAAVAAPAAVAQAAPVAPAAPAAEVETTEQKAARLEAELTALRAAQANSGSASPFDDAPVEQAAGITYQG
jgi:hypothetical protein